MCGSRRPPLASLALVDSIVAERWSPYLALRRRRPSLMGVRAGRRWEVARDGRRLMVAGGIVALVAAGVGAAARGTAPSDSTRTSRRAFTYRNIGPFRMQAPDRLDRRADGAREGSPLYLLCRPWIGGVWKTTNNGTTFEPVFDTQDDLSIGAVAVAPSDANIVWVGTGDAFTSRSSYAGDGIYKSSGCRENLDAKGSGRFAAHRARLDSPEGPERRVRRRDGALVFDQHGARRLQDDQRRRLVGEGALRQRARGRDRPRDEPEGSVGALRGNLRKGRGCPGRW